MLYAYSICFSWGHVNRYVCLGVGGYARQTRENLLGVTRLFARSHTQTRTQRR
jgi:hypothetical protein